MNFKNLSDEAKDTIQEMIFFCINNGYCMGMDEGFKTEKEKHNFRIELEEFCDYESD